jgi:phosphoribosylformylglycinamidine synthase subunit PurS
MAEYRAIVDVMLRRAILDPQGRAVQATLARLGHADVGDVRVGKRIELTLHGERDEVMARVTAIAEGVLANPVMEDVAFTLEEIPPAAGG